MNCHGCYEQAGDAETRTATPTLAGPMVWVDMTMIEQRPADAADREVPGHREGI